MGLLCEYMYTYIAILCVIFQLSQSRNIKNDETLIFKTDMITKRIKTLEERLLHTISEGERECDQVRNREKQIEERWIQELRSGGNVRYIQGREDMGWYKSCVELVNSRFLLTDFIVSHISLIDVYSTLLVIILHMNIHKYM